MALSSCIPFINIIPYVYTKKKEYNTLEFDMAIVKISREKAILYIDRKRDISFCNNGVKPILFVFLYLRAD